MVARGGGWQDVAAREWGTEELFDLMIAGKIAVDIEQHYPLAEAARAHRDLEARKTVGSTVLLPAGS